MKSYLLCLFYIFTSTMTANAQTYQQHHAKCSEILQGTTMSDTGYWKMVNRVYTCMQGANAPEFNFTTLEGKTLSLEKLKGQVIVINFWNTQCKPCIAEMPALNEIVEKFKDRNVTFISATYESRKKTIEFLKKHPLKFQNVSDAQHTISNDFLTGDIYPYSLIIDTKGKVRKIIVGGSFQKEDTFRQFVPSINQCLDLTQN